MPPIRMGVERIYRTRISFLDRDPFAKDAVFAVFAVFTGNYQREALLRRGNLGL